MCTVDLIMDQEEGQEIRETREKGGSISVCGKRRQAHSSLPKLYIRSVLRLSYDGLSSVCILHGILPA